MASPGSEPLLQARSHDLATLWSMLDHEKAIVCGEARNASSPAEGDADSDKARSRSISVGSIRQATKLSGQKSVERNRLSLVEPTSVNSDISLAAGTNSRLGREKSTEKCTLPLKVRVVDSDVSERMNGAVLASGRTVWILGTNTEERVEIRDCLGRELYEDPGYGRRRLEVLPTKPAHDDKLYPTLREAIENMQPMPKYLRATMEVKLADETGIIAADETGIIAADEILEVLENGAISKNGSGVDCLKMYRAPHWPRKQKVVGSKAPETLLVPVNAEMNVVPNIDCQGFRLPVLLQLHHEGELEFPLRVRLSDVNGQLSQRSGHKFTICGLRTVKNLVVAAEQRLVRVPVTLPRVSVTVSASTPAGLDDHELYNVLQQTVRHVDPASVPYVGAQCRGFHTGTQIRSRRRRKQSAAARSPSAKREEAKVEAAKSSNSPALQHSSSVSSNATPPPKLKGKVHLSAVHNARRHSWQHDGSPRSAPHITIADDDPNDPGYALPFAMDPKKRSALLRSHSGSAAIDVPADTNGYSTVPANAFATASTTSCTLPADSRTSISPPCSSSKAARNPVPLPRPKRTMKNDSDSDYECIFDAKLRSQSLAAGMTNLYIAQPVSSADSVRALPAQPAEKPGKRPDEKISPHHTLPLTTQHGRLLSAANPYESMDSGSASSSEDDSKYAKLGRNHRKQRVGTRSSSRRCSGDVMLWQYKYEMLQKEFNTLKTELLELRHEANGTQSLPARMRASPQREASASADLIKSQSRGKADHRNAARFLCPTQDNEDTEDDYLEDIDAYMGPAEMV